MAFVMKTRYVFCKVVTEFCIFCRGVLCVIGLIRDKRLEYETENSSHLSLVRPYEPLCRGPLDSGAPGLVLRD
jgi:hypothetical protein